MPASPTAEFFRCPVSSDCSQAKIRIGHRRFGVSVQETSIDGYTVLVGPKESKRLQVGKMWLLEYQDAIVEVHPQWFFNSPGGEIQVGLRRLRDLTPPAPVRRSLLVRIGGLKYANPNVSAAMYGGFVLVLFSVMALPGFGDQIGTAPRIQEVVKWIVGGVNDTLKNVL